MSTRLKTIFLIVLLSGSISLLKAYAGVKVSESIPKKNAQAGLHGSGYGKSLGKAKRPEYVPGEIIVKFKPGVISKASDASRKTARAGIASKEKRRFRTANIHHLQIADPNVTVEEAIKRLKSDPDVEYAEPNYIYRTMATPNDPGFGQLWGLQNIGQVVNGSAGSPDSDMDAPEAWSLQTGSSGVVIAVVDSGVDYNHPDLSANIWTNTGETSCIDGIDNDGNGYIDDCRGWDFVDNDKDPMDFNGHGTHVAGTIAAVGNNAVGVTGVNWTARIMPLRAFHTLGWGETVEAIAAIEYANDMGAHIINNSWGGVGFSRALKDVIDASTAVVVCAAGNDGADNDTTPVYPASYSSSNIISVAATDQNDNLASFSNYGATSVDVAAPGVYIYSTIAAREPVFSDDFDGAFTWTTGGTNNTWDVTAELANSAPNSLADSPGADYLDGTSSWAQTPLIDLSGKKGCKLTYQLELDVDSAGDNLCIIASKDGATWTDTPLNCYLGTTGGVFYEVEEDLIDYENEATVYIRFWLTSNDDGTAGDGAHIDDVSVTCSSTTYTGTEYDYYSGTSMATPHVAGLAGLIKAENPALTNFQIIDAILGSVDTKSSLLTSGRVNAYNALSVPPAPSDLSATATSSSKITLTWMDNSSNELGYKIERKVGASGTFAEIANVGANETGYFDAGLSASTNYYYRVRAYNAAGNSPYSDEASASTQAPMAGGGGSVSTSGGGGCFIATAAYGSYLDPHVMVLRGFRDNILLKTSVGTAFVEFYYRASPPIADFIREHEMLRTSVRWLLTPVVYSIEYPVSFGFIPAIGIAIIFRRRYKRMG